MPQPLPYVPAFRFVCAFAALVVLLLTAALRAQAPATGTVEGRVFDPRRGEFLEKARVTVPATGQETLTDGTGQYRLPNVPAGPVTLVVFYTGLGSQTENAILAAGQTLVRDVTFGSAARSGPAGEDAVKMDTFVISSSKEMDGAAIAINEQRFAKNIMSVVSADEFGTIADGSIGEFMKFLPGITSDYTGGDARRFSINGVPAGNVPISMGGFDMASAAGAGTGRQVELDQVSINSVSRIEINHSPTPENPGMALAGSVNFVPRSAFERSKPVFNYSVAALMKDSEITFRKTPGPRWGPTRKIHPGIDVSAIVPVNRNFGFTVSAGYSLQYTPQDLARIQYRGVGLATSAPAANGTPGALPDTTPDNPYATNVSVRDGNKDTTRYSFGTTVDYRLGPRDRLSFQFQYAYLHEAFANRTLEFVINRVAPGNWGRDHTWGAASTTAQNNGQINMTVGGRLRPGRTIMPTLRWWHDGPVWKAESGISWSNSRINYQDIDKGSFNTATMRRTNVTILFDDIFYLRPNKITVLDPAGRPVDPYRLDTYSIVNAVSTRQMTYDTKRQAFANLRRDFDAGGVPMSLKGGLDVRTAMRDLVGVGTTHTYTHVGRDRVASTVPVAANGTVNDDGAAVVLDESFSTRVPNYGYPPIQWVNNEELFAYYQNNPSYFTTDPNTFYRNSVNGSKHMEEIVSAAYLRADAAFFKRRLQVVGGLRVEQTNIKGEGPLNDPTLNYQRDAAGNFIRGANGRPLLIKPTTDALGVSQLTLLERAARPKKEYLRYFPNLNLNYNFLENLIGRVSYYQSLGRPDFNQYSGTITLPDTDLPNSAGNRITITNAGIKAWQAETYKARLEFYTAGVGQINFGGFIRDYQNAFDNVISRVTPEFLESYDLDPELFGNYDVATQFNVPGTVRMHGWEFEYKQALTFLPRVARGVQVFFNASSQRAKKTDSFQDMIPFSANWGASLTREKFNLRLNYNYRGIQRRAPVAAGRSIAPGTYNYRSKRLYVDVSGEYFITRRLGLFFALRNVGQASEDDKIYNAATPKVARFFTRQDYHSLWTFGLKGSF